MKILFICNEIPPAATGGIGILLRGLCEQLAARGHEIHVVGSYPGSSVLFEQDSGVQLHKLPGRFGLAGQLTDRCSLYRKIAQIAAQGPIDIIEAPDFEGPSACLPRQSRRRVVRLHGSHVYFSSERSMRPSRTLAFLENVALRQADALISVSEYTALRTQSLFDIDKPTHIVHNSPSVPAHFPRKNDYSQRRRVLYFGTIAEKKGVLSLARAWQIFLESYPDWTLVVIGRDSITAGHSVRDEMVEILRKNSLSVEFLGPVQNEELLYRLPEFDFVVLPSFSEAFALAPMEAMALGVPVIYSRLSSGPELIEHGVDGWLADPEDHRHLAQLLIHVAGDTTRLARVGRAGRWKIERCFPHNAFVDRNLAVYQEILDQRRETV